MEGLQDQEIPIFIVSGIVIMLSMALTLILFYSRAQRRLLSQKLESQEMILQKTIMAQEEERSRIARELHDDIGSKLNVISLYMHRLKKGQDEKQLGLVGEVQDVLKTSIDTTRRMSHELLPPTLEKFGLRVALEELCGGYEKAGSISFDLEVEGLDETLNDPMKALNLFRILQELIKNSALHGKAGQITIRYPFRKGQSAVYYQDDGQGVEKEKLTQAKGLGLSNIESRLNMIGGSWQFETSPGNGLKALIELE